MNQKISKLQSEKKKNTSKISALQTRNREIDQQIIELENLDIIGLVRESSLTPDMLGEIIRAMKNKPLPQPDSVNDKEDAESYEEN